MAVNFETPWSQEISLVSEESQYQTCSIRITWSEEGTSSYDYETGITTPVIGAEVVYEGPARMIPIRAGTWQGGEAQLNTTTIRSIRFQTPHKTQTRIRSGAIVLITDAPLNRNLVGRTAKVTDDIQGATMAARTFTAFLDADSEDV